MRTLVGIDSQVHYSAALSLLGRLRFAENVSVLSHVEAPVMGSLAGSPILYDGGVVEVADTLSKIGHKLLREASDKAAAAGLGAVETTYRIGSSSATLMDLAKEHRSDLVAIGSGRHGAMECFFLGSVGRAFAIHGQQSFLVARGPAKKGEVRAVFATDHSPYADRCFSRLLEMNPEGLSHVSIVTALDSNIDSSFATEVGYSDRSPYVLSAAEAVFNKKGAAMIERLVATGRTADYRILEGFPADTLRQSLTDSDCELMILGAAGHGFLERVFIGSLALHIVVAEQYPVLVVRMPEEA